MPSSSTCSATSVSSFVFFFTAAASTEIYTLSLHDALPIWSSTEVPSGQAKATSSKASTSLPAGRPDRSEEHTSELQSRFDLVCRLLLEKKNLVRQIGIECMQIYRLKGRIRRISSSCWTRKR